jgi:hypothetical protein
MLINLLALTCFPFMVQEPAPAEQTVLVSLEGMVRDPDGKPIAGATIRIQGTKGYYQTRRGTPGTGAGKTSENGRYSLFFYTKPDSKVVVTAISAEAKGFVRFREDFLFDDELIVQTGKAATWDCVLARGEVLAGSFTIPLTARDRYFGAKNSDARFFFVVRGPSFRQAHVSEPGGKFEVWVPKGNYSIELIGQRTPLPVKKENVPSGSRGLEFVRVDPPVPEEMLALAFDALWEDMARNYSYFELKKIDWTALKKKYRAQALKAGTLPKFTDVLGEMLGELNDGHVRFIEPTDAMVAYRPGRQRVGENFDAVEKSIENPVWIGNGFARAGTTKADRFPVIRITRQSRADKESVRKVVEFIRAHADDAGFLVDLRGADGGSEPLAKEIAREFCAVKSIYAKSKYRNGPKPADFGPVYDRVLEPSAKPFTKPIACILGPGCASSGEALAKMLVCLPHVTSVGLPTRGSSGNPKPYKLPGVNVTVLYSRWVDLMPDGTPVEGRGIRPNVLVDLPDSAFDKADPIWEKAVELLRTRVNRINEQ